MPSTMLTLRGLHIGKRGSSPPPETSYTTLHVTVVFPEAMDAQSVREGRGLNTNGYYK
jgi:hypothetical protein